MEASFDNTFPNKSPEGKMEPIAPALKNIQQNATKWKVKIPDIIRGILRLLPHFSIKTPNENNR
jgi:hypothetical protein